LQCNHSSTSFLSASKLIELSVPKKASSKYSPGHFEFGVVNPEMWRDSLFYYKSKVLRTPCDFVYVPSKLPEKFAIPQQPLKHENQPSTQPLVFSPLVVDDKELSNPITKNKPSRKPKARPVSTPPVIDSVDLPHQTTKIKTSKKPKTLADKRLALAQALGLADEDNASMRDTVEGKLSIGKLEEGREMKKRDGEKRRVQRMTLHNDGLVSALTLQGTTTSVNSMFLKKPHVTYHKLSKQLSMDIHLPTLSHHQAEEAASALIPSLSCPPDLIPINLKASSTNSSPCAPPAKIRQVARKSTGGIRKFSPATKNSVPHVPKQTVEKSSVLDSCPTVKSILNVGHMKASQMKKPTSVDQERRSPRHKSLLESGEITSAGNSPSKAAPRKDKVNLSPASCNSEKPSKTTTSPPRSPKKKKSKPGRKKRSLLDELASSAGYVAEKKIGKHSEDLLVDPSRLSREERALQVRTVLAYHDFPFILALPP
jgi:hypothetical protein